MKAITSTFAWRLMTGSLKNFSEDRALRLAAALAYYSIFALAPLLLITVAIASTAFGEQALRDELDDQLELHMGRPAAEGVQSLLKNAAVHQKGTMAVVIGFVTLLVGASGFFTQLKDALNTVWQVQAHAAGGVMSFIRDRLLSFAMVLVIGLLFLLSLGVTTLLANVTEYAESVVAIPQGALKLLNSLVSIALGTLLFAAIFKVLPDVRVPWRTVMTGALLTALLFEAGKIALAFYLARPGMSSSFGAAGSLIVVLLWVYYASAILLLGAEMTQTWAQLQGHRLPMTEFAGPCQAIEQRNTVCSEKEATVTQENTAT